MNSNTGGFSVISSAWFALMYGTGNAQERLANALVRSVALEMEHLSQPQQSLFQLLSPGRLREYDHGQMLVFVESLGESKLHHLCETIAQLYFVTVQPT